MKGWLDKYQDGGVAKTDATRVNKQMIPLNAKKVTQKQLDEREAQARRDRINKANVAKDKMYTNPEEPIFGFSPEVFAESTSAIGDKLRVSDLPNVFDDYINPASMFGHLASGLGKVPLNIKEGNYGEAALNTLAPIAAGAAETLLSPIINKVMKRGNKATKDKSAILAESNQLAPPPSEIIFPSSWNNPSVQKAEKLRSIFWNPSPNTYISEGGLNWLRDNGGVSFRDIYHRNIPIERASPDIINHIRNLQKDRVRDLTPREMLVLSEHGFGNALSSVVSNPSLRSRLDQGIQSALGMNNPSNYLTGNRPSQSLLQSLGESIYSAFGGRRNQRFTANNDPWGQLQTARNDKQILENTARNYAAANSYNPPRGAITSNDGTVLAVGGARDITNRSGLDKSTLLANDALVNKDAVSKMAPEEFASTVYKPSGEVTPYQTMYDPLPGVYGMSPSQYANRFNENLDLLNDIISKQNKTGVDYRVTGLDESGMLTFHTPKQIKRWQDDPFNVKMVEDLEKLKNDPVELQKRLHANAQTLEDFDRGINYWKEDRIIAPEGNRTWAARIIPGEFRGEIQDIPNAEYYKSIPGLNISSSSQGVFSDNVTRRGSGAYEAINEYLKRLDLGRVKPGFNSQSDSSRPLWENAIKKGKAFGYYDNPHTVYGAMNTVAPLIGAGAVASQLVDQKKNGGWLEKYNDGGPVQPNYNDASVSMSDDFIGDGYSNVGRNYSPAWGGQFAMGGSIGGATQGIPGATGFMYSRDSGSNPSEDEGRNKVYKTDASAQNGKEMKFYQEGLDFKPKSISKDGSKVIKDDRGQWAHPGEITEISSNQITMRGVPYPVMGISDTGDMQMMYPDEDYVYDGESVTEIPMMREGGTISKKTLARNQRIAESNAAQNQPLTPESLATRAIAIPDKLRLSEQMRNISPGLASWMEENPTMSYIDENLNPLVIAGKLASKLGQVPLNVKQGNYRQALLNTISPMLIREGAITTENLSKSKNKFEQGGQLTKLDQLTNFTNYNTKQPGGWLDKYQ